MSFGQNVVRAGKRWAILLGWGVLALGPANVQADEAAPPETITRVEEDWLLWVGQPADAIFSPQFHTVMSPFGNMEAYYFQVTWNYLELPDFTSGGFQVQSWNGEDHLENQDVYSSELSRTAEIITWTQVLETNGQQIGFSVMDGVSSSWGTFGHPETTIIHDGSISNLNGYRPDVSVGNSWITYGQNRVAILKIKAVRYYGAHGLIRTDSTSRVVYQFTGH